MDQSSLLRYITKRGNKDDFDVFNENEKSNILRLMGWHDPNILEKVLLSRWKNSLEVPVGKFRFEYTQTWISSYRSIRYCPICLKEDTEPYLRIWWRLLLIPICLKHEVFLQTGCCDPVCLHPNPINSLLPTMRCIA